MKHSFIPGRVLSFDFESYLVRLKHAIGKDSFTFNNIYYAN